MSTPPTVLVTGATGRVGRHVVAGLLGRGAHVRALVRRPLLAGLPDEVEIVAGDLMDPAVVGRAASGADAAFLLWPTFSPDGLDPVVEAIASDGTHVVPITAAIVQGDEEGVMSGVYTDVEEAVARAATSWTFVRGGGFAVNTLQWAEQVRAGEPVRIPFPEAGRSLVHERDLADVIVASLLDPEHRGRAYAVTGPETLTQREQVAAIAEAAGTALEVVERDPEEVRAEIAAIDLAFADKSIAYWSSLVDRPERVTDDVERVTGHPARTFAEWARDHVDDFRARSVADVAQAYVDGFRGGDPGASTALLHPDVVRVAPLEPGPDEVHGLEAVLQNAVDQNDGIEVLGVEIDGPMVGPDAFAMRVSFDERVVATGRRRTTTKVSVCTVRDSRIVREEVSYLTPAHPA